MSRIAFALHWVIAVFGLFLELVGFERETEPPLRLGGVDFYRSDVKGVSRVVHPGGARYAVVRMRSGANVNLSGYEAAEFVAWYDKNDAPRAHRAG